MGEQVLSQRGSNAMTLKRFKAKRELAELSWKGVSLGLDCKGSENGDLALHYKAQNDEK